MHARYDNWVPSPDPDSTDPLPYQELLEQSDREGRVLHRNDIYGSGPSVDAVSEEIFAFVNQNVGESILDVGCGLGPYVERLTKVGRTCIGVDLDPEAVARARELGRDVHRMSAYSLAFRDASFDSVIMIETLEHLADYEQALAEAARVARRTIVVTVPDIAVLPLMSKRQVVPWHLLEATHLNFFTPQTLQKVLLRFAASCRVSRLGKFFEVDGESAHMHLGAVATISAPWQKGARSEAVGS